MNPRQRRPEARFADSRAQVFATGGRVGVRRVPPAGISAGMLVGIQVSDAAANVRRLKPAAGKTGKSAFADCSATSLRAGRFRPAESAVEPVTSANL